MVFYAFDLLYLDGYDLTKFPLIERKTLLAGLLDDAPAGRRRALQRAYRRRTARRCSGTPAGSGLEGHRLEAQGQALHRGPRLALAQAKCTRRAGVRHRRLRALDDLDEGRRLARHGRQRERQACPCRAGRQRLHRSRWHAQLWSELEPFKRAQLAFAAQLPRSARAACAGSSRSSSPRSSFAAGRPTGCCVTPRSRACATTRIPTEVVREKPATAPIASASAAACRFRADASGPDLLAGRRADEAGARRILRRDCRLASCRTWSGGRSPSSAARRGSQTSASFRSSLGRHGEGHPSARRVRGRGGARHRGSRWPHLARAGQASSRSIPGARRLPIEKPDRITIDLDPAEDVRWTALIEVRSRCGRDFGPRVSRASSRRPGARACTSSYRSRREPAGKT